MAHDGHLVALREVGLRLATEEWWQFITAKAVLGKRIATASFLRKLEYQVSV